MGLALARGLGDGRSARGILEGEHLVERFAIGDELRGLELTAGGAQLKGVHLEVPAQGRVGVVTEALGIGDRHQEQVERPGPVGAAFQAAVTDQAVVDPAKSAGDLAQPLRSNRVFVDLHIETGVEPIVGPVFSLAFNANRAWRTLVIGRHDQNPTELEVCLLEVVSAHRVRSKFLASFHPN